MVGRPPEALLQDARLGQGKAFVLAASANEPLQVQAEDLFGAVARCAAGMSGWLIDDRFLACAPAGFAEYMARREAGEATWDRECPHEFSGDESFPTRPIFKIKQPYTMLTFAGYPCWVVGRKLVSLDLFNAGNELLLPYSDPGTRLWSIWLFPPRVVMPDSAFGAILQAAAAALDAHYGFGGQWLAQAIYAYRFAAWSDNNYLKPLDPSVRLTDLSYPYMLVRAKDLSPGLIERLQSEEFSVRRAGRPETITTCDLLGPEDRYVFLRLGPVYPDANDDLVTRVGELIGKPYAKTMIARESD